MIRPRINLNKDTWYRIPDREQTNYKADKSLVDTYVQASRLIVRAGYFYEPTDLDEDTVIKMCKEKLIKDHDWITSKRYNELIDYLDLFESRLFYRMKYFIRGQWKEKRIRELEGEDKIRTLWYVDIDPNDPGHLYIDKISTKKIGEGGTEYEYSDWGGYESYSYWNQYSSHQLYKIYWPSVSLQETPITAYIHPEDIINA